VVLGAGVTVVTLGKLTTFVCPNIPENPLDRPEHESMRPLGDSEYLGSTGTNGNEPNDIGTDDIPPYGNI
jgi:hypothetical protein